MLMLPCQPDRPSWGQVVEPLKLTVKELAAYSGADKGKPILLAIRGVIFDVSRGACNTHII